MIKGEHNLVASAYDDGVSLVEGNGEPSQLSGGAIHRAPPRLCPILLCCAFDDPGWSLLCGFLVLRSVRSFFGLLPFGSFLRWFLFVCHIVNLFLVFVSRNLKEGVGALTGVF